MTRRKRLFSLESVIGCHLSTSNADKKEETRRKRQEGRDKKEETRRKRQGGRDKKEET